MNAPQGFPEIAGAPKNERPAGEHADTPRSARAREAGAQDCPGLLGVFATTGAGAEATCKLNARRAANKACVDRYRQKRRRLEFFPSADVLSIIERHKAGGLDPTLAGTIDELIRAGHHALTGITGAPLMSCNQQAKSRSPAA